MGGTKKKGLAAMEKQQDSTEGASAGEAAQSKGKKGKETKGGPSQQKRMPFLLPKITDEEAVRSLTPLKAITVHGAARALGVNAAIATTMLYALEGKNLIRKVGGFSGHYIWAAPQKS